MEVAALVLEYIKVLAWPALVLTLGLQFRNQLARLLDRVATETEELSAPGGLTVKFRPSTIDEQAERLLEESDAAATPEPPTEVPTDAEGAIADDDEPLLNKYFFAEELVLRALEARWSLPIQRQAAIELGGGRTIHTDGVARTAQGITIIEVKLLTAPLLPGSVVDAMCAQVEALEGHFEQRVKGVLALATTLPPNQLDRVIKGARERLADRYAEVRVEEFRLSSLMRSFLGVRD